MQLKFFLAASAASISLACSLATPVAAQQITTGIEGAVTDENGAPLSGAEVTITDTRTGATRTLTTGESGSYSATGLTTGGPYTVSANAAGYEGQSLPDVFTTLQGNTSLTFSLSGGSGQIVVSGARVRSAQLAVGPGQSFTEAVLEAAPSFNRDIRDVLRLDPRVSLDRDDLSGADRVSCLGGNDRSNGFTIDGISQGDLYGLSDTPFSSRTSTPVPYDAIRETQVQFAPFDVEFGGFTGCAINAVTKSGSNEFHGSAFFEYTDDGMTGDQRKLPVLAGEDPRLKSLPFKDKRWGATLGGPIIKDRLFFFGAYEEQDGSDPEEVGPGGAGYPTSVTNIPLADFQNISNIAKNVYGIDNLGLATSLPFKNRRFFGRLDAQISDDHRFEATYQRIDETQVKSDDQFSTGSSPQLAGYSSYYKSGSHSDYFSGRLYSQWTDALSTEVRYSKAKIDDEQDPVGGGEAQDANPIPRFIVGVQNTVGGVTSRGAVLIGPGNNRSANDLYTEVDQYKVKGTYKFDNHELTAGVELNDAYIYNLFVANATGTLVFRNATDFAAGLLSPGTQANQTSTSSSTNIANGAVEGAFINATPTGAIGTAAAELKRRQYSAYVQDEWRVNDQLDLVMGVRVDHYEGNRPMANPVFASRFGTTNTTGFSDLDPVFLPRIGFTYKPEDFAIFARPVVKGGIGIFSGGDPLVWFGNAFQNNGMAIALGSSDGSFGTCPAGQIDVVTNGTFTGFPTCARTAGANTAATNQGATQSVDPNIKVPTVLRANIGFDAEMFPGEGFLNSWRLNLDYIWARYRNPLTIVDLAQTVDIRTGLAGYAIDGRPIYAQINPTQAGCAAKLTDGGVPPVYTGVTAACYTTAANRVDELRLTNSDGYTSQIASIILSKNFDRGLFTEGGSVYFNFGYAYTDAHDRRNMYNSTAGSNYDNVAAFDRQNPGESRGYYGNTHNVSTSLFFTEEFFGDFRTKFGGTFVARSGRPYSLTWTGSGVFNPFASGSDNALLYIPTGISDANIAPTSNAAAVQSLVTFLDTIDCDDEYRGRTIERNTCSNNWYYDLDLSFSQELPGPGRLFGVQDRLKLTATMDNFLNFLDPNWNNFRRRQFAGFQDLATTSGVDSQGRYVITSAAGLTSFGTDDQLKVSSSLWRLKVGVSYEF